MYEEAKTGGWILNEDALNTRLIYCTITLQIIQYIIIVRVCVHA